MLPDTVQTINQLIDTSVERYGGLPALSAALRPPLSYEEFHREILLAAAALKDLGIRKNDRVAILAENSPQWGIAYLATVRLGAVAVPILPDFPGADVRHILTEVGARLLFTCQRQLEKLYELPEMGLKAIVPLDDGHDQNRLLATLPFSRFLQNGRDLPEKKKIPGPDPVAPEDLASIIYTSGTSGHSKAVMLSHRNFISNLRATLAIFKASPIEGWTFLSILPLSHAYEFTVGFLAPLATGSRIVYTGKSPTPTVLERICRMEQPTALCAVPLVMEKIHKKKVLAGLNRPLVRLAMRLPPVRRTIMKQIGARLLKFFGGRLQIIAIGGAPLNIETETFLREAGLPYLVGYGLTEASPLVSAGPYGDPTINAGSAGKPVEGVEVRTKEPLPPATYGEILIRGANLMRGYYNNPEASRKAIDQDGWLHTGDLGYLDADGNLFVLGRSKNVIVLSHGENIYPETIEEKINGSGLVLESLVLAHNQRLEARVYLDYDRLDRELAGSNQAKKQARIARILEEIKKQVNRQLPPYAQLAAITEHREPFAKTATEKIKRYLYTETSGNQPEV